jgi:hypothetical protein
MSNIGIYIRQYLTRILVIVCILTVIASYIFVSPQISRANTELQLWNSNIGTFALFTGFITIFIRFGRKVMNREEDWQFGIYTLFVIIAWTAFGIYNGSVSAVYIKAYYATKVALHAASIGMLVFFFLSAVFRVFRINDLRGAILPICASILVAANAPWAQSIFPGITNIGMWFMDNMQMAGARSIVMVAAVGGIALGVRVLLGLEHGALRAVKSSEGGEG